MRSAFRLFLPALLCLPCQARAAVESLLKIDPSARSAALGSARAAETADAWSLFGNPAALAGPVGRQALLTHAAWLEGDAFQAAGVVLPVKNWTAGGGFLRLTHGDLDGRDEQRRPTGSFSSEEQALVMSLARRWGPLGAGASAKFLRERIGDSAVSGWAADGGVSLAPAGALFSWGAALQNIRTERPGDGSASLGAAVRAPGLGLAAVDIVRSLDGDRTEVRMGLERWVLGSLALRAGYSPSLLRKSAAPAWRTGMGLRRGALQLDYALVPVGELGVTQRMSVSFQF